MSAHSQGPWEYRPQEFDDWGVVRTTIPTEDGWYPIVAVARDVGIQNHALHRSRHTDPTEGNARLIAAAPDLLAALRECRALLDGEGGIPKGVRGRADAALAKATALHTPLPLE